MPRLTVLLSRSPVLCAILVAQVAMVLFSPVSAVAGEKVGIGKGPSAGYSTKCEPGGNHKLIDPVGVIFRGGRANAAKTKFEVGRLANWTYEGLGPQRLRVRLPNGNYGCREVDKQPASEPDYRLIPPEIPEERFHMRLWFIPASANFKVRKTVGTPHHEDFIEHDPTGISDHCTGEASVEIPFTGLELGVGTHAVDKGGGETGEESGFDQARHALREAFKRGNKKVEPEQWGNDQVIEQCDEDSAGSDGYGLLINLNRVNAGQTGHPSSRASSALLRGRMETEETTDWWFEYGPNSSEGVSGYPNKTAVRSTSGASELDVDQPISGLSPSTTYYVRIFARDSEGEVEEGNEIEFATCGRENFDEDDESVGPRPITPECGGPVDTFYRDVNGDLAHHSWSPSRQWTTETRPANIARSAIPQATPRSDGSGVFDVFYKEADGNLGHQWLTPGAGWNEETVSASLASNPNVVTRPDGTIDVFYRTMAGELGHSWWKEGSGWSSETRAANLSSVPHAVVLEDGSIDVFYRSESSLGRDYWSPESGWSHEVRSGELAAEPRPIAGEGGTLDVFYRTTEDQLGRDRFVPGAGWSREIRSASVASDPHVVARSDGTIDVFYRTAAAELGHDWWASGTGWSTEVRPGTLSSAPHAIARADGSLEVFYRSGNQIGRQWYVPEQGWTAETLRGPIATHTDPHVVTQSNGRIDVLYETPTEYLGHDWYEPSRGWSHEIRPMGRPSPPLAAWAFDEGTGSVAHDLSGNRHDAAIHGAKWTTKGHYGSALEFNAPEETYISVPASEDLDGNEELTIEAWVRPHESRYLGEIMMKEREGSGAKYSWTLDQHLSEPVGYFMQNEEGMVAGGEGSLPLNTWTHVAMTDDGAHNRLYVNGQLVDTEPTIPFDGHGEIRIGGNGVFGQWFDGRIDEVRIYDRALSEAEIQVDGSAPLQTPQKAPVAAYSFDENEEGEGGEEGEGEGEEGEGEGSTVEDLSGGGHTGIIEGAEWTRGRYGGSLKFDGEDQLTIPASEDLNLTEAFTLEAWIKPEAEGEYGHLFVKEDAAEEQTAYVISKHESRLLARLGIPGVEEESPTETLELGSWQHIAATYDGNRIRLYVNGELVGNAAVAEILSTDGALRIGGADLWWSDEGFKGRIDEVRVYNRALGAGEIAADRATPLETPPAAPVAAWSFDDGEGAVATSSAGEHDATIEGAGWVKGRYGSALEFDGVNDCVVAPGGADLQFTQDGTFTIEAWVRPGEAAESAPIITQEDEATPEGEQPFAYTLLAGGEDEPAGWVREDSGGEGASVGISGTEALPVGSWSHLALTDDGAKLRLYVDGALQAIEPSPPLTASEGPLTIGCNQILGDYFDGRIDDVRIYDRALEVGEVAGDH